MTIPTKYLTISLITEHTEAMLRYLNGGIRFYHTRQVNPYRRDLWEIQAVLSGRCGIIPSEGGRTRSFSTKQQNLRLRQSNLWVFPPRHLHGWTGEYGKSAEIVVFHFSNMPEPLAGYVRRRGMLSIPIKKDTGKHLRDIYQELLPVYSRPGMDAPLYFGKSLYTISLIITDYIGEEIDPPGKDRADWLVYSAIAWFRDNLGPGIGVEDTARAAGVSESHLRRLFHRVTGACPRDCLQEQQIRRAKDYLSGGALPLEQIAEYCGFSSLSSFSRAFRREEGISPQMWRRTVGRKEASEPYESPDRQEASYPRSQN